MTVIGDETLTAYLDGELSKAEEARVARALGSDPELAARLGELDLSVAELRGAFDAVLPSAPAMPGRSARRGGGLAIAAALGLGLLVGAGAATWVALERESDWTFAVAMYQALYVPATLEGPLPDTDRAQARLSDLSADLGRDVTPAAVAPGVAFRRAQMLGFQGRPLVQIAYVTPDGTPVALCVTRLEAGDHDLRTGSMLGLASAFWVRDGYGYLLIGGDDPDLIDRLAADLKTRV